MFIEYTEESKEYRIYNPKTKNIIMSRDAIFEEGKVYEYKKKCMVDIGGEVPNKEKASNLKMVQLNICISLLNLQIVPLSPPSTSSNSSKSTPTSPSSGGSPNVIAKVMKIKRDKNHFQNHPPSYVLDPNFHERLTKS